MAKKYRPAIYARNQEFQYLLNNASPEDIQKALDRN